MNTNLNMFLLMIFLFPCIINPAQKGVSGSVMTVKQLIKTSLAYQGMTEAELARKLGSSPAAFNNRMQREKFSVEDLRKIAEALGGEYFFGIRFPDGKEI